MLALTLPVCGGVGPERAQRRHGNDGDAEELDDRTSHPPLPSFRVTRTRHPVTTVSVWVPAPCKSVRGESCTLQECYVCPTPCYQEGQLVWILHPARVSVWDPAPSQQESVWASTLQEGQCGFCTLQECQCGMQHTAGVSVDPAPCNQEGQRWDLPPCYQQGQCGI